MSNWKSDFIQSNGLRIHYTRTGGDKPPFVLAHGFSDDGLCWTPVAEKLVANYDVIMVDARGHGRSEAPEQGYGLTDMATDLAGVITGLGLHQPTVMGHSMGGGTTLLMAGMFPEVPGKILIEDAGMFNMAGPQTPEALARAAQMRNRIINLKRKNREELLAECRITSPTWSDGELEPWADAKLRFSLHATNRIGTTVIDWDTWVKQISCPALLIIADPERGAIINAEGAATMQQLIPQLQVSHIASAGHNIRREQFGRFMAVINDFLAEK